MWYKPTDIFFSISLLKASLASALSAARTPSKKPGPSQKFDSMKSFFLRISILYPKPHIPFSRHSAYAENTIEQALARDLLLFVASLTSFYCSLRLALL